MIDLSIIVAYLIITIVVGFIKGRNITTMKDFSVASYNYSIPVIVATVSATIIGGEAIVGVTEMVYQEGLIFMLVCVLACPLSSLLLAFFLAPRFGRFHGMISIGDVMGSFYGKPGKVITGIAGVLLSSGYIGAQVSAIGYFCNYFFEMPHIVGIMFGSGVVVAYSTFGGIRAVTATDVIQFGVLVIAVPMLCNIGINIVGGYSALMSSIPAKHLSLSPKDVDYFQYIGMFILFSIPFLDPALAQRMLMTKNIKQASAVMKITALFEIPFIIIICMIAFVALSISPDLDPHLVAPYLINTILPVGIKGFCLAGMFAVIMSTADSYLNAASITIVHDVIKPLRKKPTSDQQELKLTRFSTFILGALAIVAAASFEGIMDIIISFCNFWGPVVLIPLIAGLYGYKACKRAFVASAVAGVCTFLIWVFWCEGHLGVDSFVPSMVANALVFFGLNEYLKRKDSGKKTMPLDEDVFQDENDLVREPQMALEEVLR